MGYGFLVFLLRWAGLPQEQEVTLRPFWEQPFPGAPGIEGRIFNLMQEIRRQAGLPLFQEDSALQQGARQHSLEMYREGYFSHESPHTDWRTPIQRAYLAGFWDAAVGENIGQVYRSRGASEEEFAQEFVRGWMNSPPHRRNILSPEYTRLGVGVYGDGKHFFATQLFGSPAFEFRNVRLRQERVVLYRWEVVYRTAAQRLGLWVNGEFSKEVAVQNRQATLVFEMPANSGIYRLQVGADQVFTAEFRVDTSKEEEAFENIAEGRRAELLQDRSRRMEVEGYCLEGEALPLLPVGIVRLRVNEETRARYIVQPGKFFPFSLCLPKGSGIYHIGLFPDTRVKYYFFLDTNKPLSQAFLPRRTEV